MLTLAILTLRLTFLRFVECTIAFILCFQLANFIKNSPCLEQIGSCASFQEPVQGQKKTEMTKPSYLMHDLRCGFCRGLGRCPRSSLQ